MFGQEPDTMADKYIQIKRPDIATSKSGYIAEHRAVWIDANGAIPPGAVVHHIDGDKTNNHISNLALCRNNGEHRKLHNQTEYPNADQTIAPFDLVDLMFLQNHIPLDRILTETTP